MTISAKVICDSVSEQGIRLTTFEIEVPRLVWSEMMTHRMFSRNAASSRAIPFAKMQQQLTGIPASFGKNQSGMTASGTFDALIEGKYTAEQWWNLAKESASGFSKGYSDAGYHKQVFNRLTESFQSIKAVVSATEWDNFFWLRDDGSADPTIEALAKAMKEAYNNSVPCKLRAGEWHLPYVDTYVYPDGRPEVFYGIYIDNQVIEISTEDAIKVSGARCAAVSYRNTDYTVEKSLQVYERLVTDIRIHGSALEHQATPITAEICYGDVNIPENPLTWQDGVTHMDKKGNLWSGNFKGFVQQRKLIPNENYFNK